MKVVSHLKGLDAGAKICSGNVLHLLGANPGTQPPRPLNLDLNWETGKKQSEFCFSDRCIAPYLVLFSSGWATAPCHSLGWSLWVSGRSVPPPPTPHTSSEGCEKKRWEIGGAFDNICSLPVWLLNWFSQLVPCKKGKYYALIFIKGLWWRIFGTHAQSSTRIHIGQHTQACLFVFWVFDMCACAMISGPLRAWQW